jgi:hypothetical protein
VNGETRSHSPLKIRCRAATFCERVRLRLNIAKKHERILAMSELKTTKVESETESLMSLQHAKDIAECANALMTIIKPEKDLEDWVDFKISGSFSPYKNNPLAVAVAVGLNLRLMSKLASGGIFEF